MRSIIDQPYRYFLWVIFIFAADCKGSTYYECFIDNQSAQTVKVISVRKVGLVNDTTDIPPGTRQGFFHTEKMGSDEYRPDPIGFFDTIQTQITGFVLSKNIMDSQEWEKETKQTKRTPSIYLH